MSHAPLLAMLGGSLGAWAVAELASVGGELARKRGRGVARALATLADVVARLGSEGRAPGAAERRRLLFAGAAIAFAMGWLLAGPAAGAALAATGPWVVGRALAARRDHYRRGVDRGAAAMATAMADALGAGHSLRGALWEAAAGVHGGAGHELRRVGAELAAGARTDDALEEMRARVRSGRLDTIVAACLVQRRAGGDLARLLRECAESFGDQDRLEEEVRSATAQARFTGVVVVLLPIGGALLAELADPGFIAGLWGSLLTAWLVGLALALQVVAAVLIRRLGEGPVVTAAALAFAAGALGILGLTALAGGRVGPRRAGARPGPRLLRGLAALGRRAAGDRAPRDLADRIAAAGRPGGLGPREVMAAKVTAAAIAGVAGALLSVVAPGRLGIALIGIAPPAGFLAPDLWLYRRASTRARAVRRELPALLDMLRVTVDAGASLTAAMSEVGGRARGPLAAEWQAVGREAALGVPLSDALEGMGRRLPQPEVEALIGALDRARRHGAPLGATLARQARDCRFGLRRAVQEEAARAGPKIQLVVALLLVPSVLLMVAAALAAALLESGGVPGT